MEYFGREPRRPPAAAAHVPRRARGRLAHRGVEPPEARDPDLSARGRDAALAAVLAEQPPGDARTGAAMQLRQQLPDVESLTPNERALLADWLDRIASAPPPAGRRPGVEGV